MANRLQDSAQQRVSDKFCRSLRKGRTTTSSQD
jgi:hypothetical protein